MVKKKTARITAAAPTTENAGIHLVPKHILPLVRFIRGEKVLLDADLAELYGVETKALNQAMKRNRKRFPADFIFQLSAPEWKNLKSQSVTSSHGGRRTPPYAFTEQGVAMLSSVLNSDRAIEVNIAIMRTFVQLRELMADNQMLQEKIERLEKKYDGQFAQVFDAIKRLMNEREDD
ncbi:MAG: ORF6N domain-containing protein [Opitutales bacterium]